MSGPGGARDDSAPALPEATVAQGPEVQTAVRALIDDAEAREDREVDAALDTALGIVALVGAPDFAAPGETVGVHPMRRLLPPSDLEGFADRVEHLLLGHGDALHGEAARGAMRDALAGSRRRLPALLGAQALRAVRGRYRG